MKDKKDNQQSVENCIMGQRLYLEGSSDEGDGFTKAAPDHHEREVDHSSNDPGDEEDPKYEVCSHHVARVPAELGCLEEYVADVVKQHD